MGIPTVEEYQAALKTKTLLADWIGIEKENLDKLLDQIIDSRKTILAYQSEYQKAREIVDRYRIYEELEREKQNAW